jgi:hypothetical protein
MGYSALEHLRDNLAAIEVALKQSERSFSTVEVEALQRYSGFGGIKAVLFGEGSFADWRAHGATEDDLALYQDVQKLFALIRGDIDPRGQVIQSLKESTLTGYYTPRALVGSILTAIADRGIIPCSLYEPSAGAGIFIEEAIRQFGQLKEVKAAENDYVTGMVLTALSSTYPKSIQTDIQIKPLEETDATENGKFDLVASNIPFGDIRIFDPAIKEAALTRYIHNYFFAKGLEKLREGGLLAYVTTENFLNSPANGEARRAIFMRSDFLAVAALPESTFADQGTEVQTHVIFLQRNSGKQVLTPEEEQLCRTVRKESEKGIYAVNAFLDSHREVYLGCTLTPGLDLYGKPKLLVQDQGGQDALYERLRDQLTTQLQLRYREDGTAARVSVSVPQVAETQKAFTYLELPAKQASSNAGVQLGMFDTIAVEESNRALDYITAKDEETVRKQSAKMIGIIRTTENLDHESIVLLTAKTKHADRYQYRIQSNVYGPHFPKRWMNAAAFSGVLGAMGETLRAYPYQYVFEGDRSLEHYLGFARDKRNIFRDVKSYYRHGTLVLHGG